jgi:transcriptional regulator with XRE-family HTH domain
MTDQNPTHDEVKEMMFSDDPELRAEYDELEPAYLVAREILRVRGEMGISQAELARRMGTSQSVVSRLENMEGSPNLRTVIALAKALDRKVELRFVPEGTKTVYGEAHLTGRGTLTGWGEVHHVFLDTPVGRAAMDADSLVEILEKTSQATFSRAKPIELAFPHRELAGRGMKEGDPVAAFAEALGVDPELVREALPKLGFARKERDMSVEEEAVEA